MKRIDPYRGNWLKLAALAFALSGGAFLGDVGPATAALKRVIILEYPAVGFPPFIDVDRQDYMRIAPLKEMTPTGGPDTLSGSERRPAGE